MKKETEYFPLKIRADWKALAPEKGQRSEMPPLDEMGMADLVCSMARFAVAHQDDHVIRLSQEFNESFGGRVLATHAQIGFYLLEYIQENASLSAEAMVEMRLAKDDQGHETRACAYIAKNDNLSFGEFLKHWLNHVEPEYAQSAMLHTHDALTEIIDPEAGIGSGARVLRDAYVNTGLKMATRSLRNQLPRAEDQPSLMA